MFLFGVMSLHAQDIPTYPVLQEIENGTVTSLQEGEDGSYFVMYMMDYNETLQIEPSGIELSGDLGLDSIPPESGYVKLAKFDKDDNLVAEQDLYSYVFNSHFEHMKYDNGNIIIEVVSFYLIDTSITTPRTIWIGDIEVTIPEKMQGLGNFLVPTIQTYLVLDAETLEHVNDFTISSDWVQYSQVGNWDVQDGNIYLRTVAVNSIVTGIDTFTVDHPPGQASRWVNVMKYNYLESKVEWSKMVIYGLGFSTAHIPLFFGVEVSDAGRIYLSGGDYGRPTYLLGDTLNTWDASQGVYIDYLDLQGSTMVLDTDGNFVDLYHIDSSNAFVLGTVTIDEYTYMLIDLSVDLVTYRGLEIELPAPWPHTDPMVMKVDENGDYVDHWNVDSDCDALYLYMRKTVDKEIILFGKYTHGIDDCSNTTAEGLPFVSTQNRNGSLLTLDMDLKVVSSQIFEGKTSADSDFSIPKNNHISSSAKYVSYTSDRVVTQEEILNNIGELSKINQNNKLIFPNPAKDYFRFDISDEVQKNIQIHIYTNHGILVKKQNAIGGENIDISDLTSGIYIVKATTPYNIFTQKLIKI